MNQHIEASVDEKCSYCGQRNGTLLASEYDAEGIPLQWHHIECKKQATREYLQRQWQRQYHDKGGL